MDFRFLVCVCFFVFFFSSRRRHTRLRRDWSSDVCSSDLEGIETRDPSVAPVLSEEFAIDENFEIVPILFDLDSGMQRQGCNGKECKGKCAHGLEPTIQAGSLLRGKQECWLL